MSDRPRGVPVQRYNATKFVLYPPNPYKNYSCEFFLGDTPPNHPRNPYSETVQKIIIKKGFKKIMPLSTRRSVCSYAEKICTLYPTPHTRTHARTFFLIWTSTSTKFSRHCEFAGSSPPFIYSSSTFTKTDRRPSNSLLWAFCSETYQHKFDSKLCKILLTVCGFDLCCHVRNTNNKNKLYTVWFLKPGGCSHSIFGFPCKS